MYPRIGSIPSFPPRFQNSIMFRHEMKKPDVLQERPQPKPDSPILAEYEKLRGMERYLFFLTFSWTFCPPDLCVRVFFLMDRERGRGGWEVQWISQSCVHELRTREIGTTRTPLGTGELLAADRADEFERRTGLDIFELKYSQSKLSVMPKYLFAMKVGWYLIMKQIVRMKCIHRRREGGGWAAIGSTTQGTKRNSPSAFIIPLFFTK